MLVLEVYSRNASTIGIGMLHSTIGIGMLVLEVREC